MNTHDQFEVFIKGKHKLTKKGKKKQIYDHNCKFIIISNILERERKKNKRAGLPISLYCANSMKVKQH